MTRNEVVFVSLSVAAVALILAGVAWAAAMTCERQWQRSGMESDWALLQGCMVRRADGTWIPSVAYREIMQ